MAGRAGPVPERAQGTTPLAARGQLRALIYDRVSTRTQAASGYSSGEDGFQFDQCRTYATRDLGAVVVGEESDADSGRKWDIQGLTRALERARAGEFDVLVVWDTDRFARNLAKRLVYENEFKRLGVQVRYVRLPVGDSPEDRLLLNIRGVIDEYESEKIALRMTNGRLQKARLGLFVGTGEPPYGYRKVHRYDDNRKRDVVVGIEPDPVTAPIVRRIFEEAQRRGVRELCELLDREGVPPPKSKFWSPSSVKQWLYNPTYRGVAVYSRDPSNRKRPDLTSGIKVPVPQIVDDALWHSVHDALARRKNVRRPRGRRQTFEYELRGMLACAHCGGTLSCTDEPSGKRYYYCLRHSRKQETHYGRERCPLRIVDARAVEAEAWRLVSAALLDPDRLVQGVAAARELHDQADQLRRERVATLDAELDKLRARLNRTLDELLDTPRSSESYPALQHRRSQYESAIASVKLERDRLDAEPGPGLTESQAEQLANFARDVRAGIQNAGPEHRREIYRLLRLRATLTFDQARGIRLSKRGWFVIEWEAVVEILDNGRAFL